MDFVFLRVTQEERSNCARFNKQTEKKGSPKRRCLFWATYSHRTLAISKCCPGPPAMTCGRDKLAAGNKHSNITKRSRLAYRVATILTHKCTHEPLLGLPQRAWVFLAHGRILFALTNGSSQRAAWVQAQKHDKTFVNARYGAHGEGDLSFSVCACAEW